MRCVTKQLGLLSFMTICLLVSTAMPTAEGNNGQAGLCERLKPCQHLNQAAAERILGQPARFARDISELKGTVRQCGCAYTGVANDAASGQASTLYFILEQKEGSPSAEQARQLLATIKNDNAHDVDINDLAGIGDEAFLFSSGPSDCFMMARKGGVVMRVQIKNAKKFSVEELKAFAKAVVSRL